MKSLRYILLTTVLLFAALACQSRVPASASTPVAVVPSVSSAPALNLTPTEMKYHLMEHFGEVFFCDPDYYPVGRPGAEEQNEEKFRAILTHLKIEQSDTYTDEQKLRVYREHKRLRAVQLEPAGDAYAFELRIGQDNNGKRIQGTINSRGEITIESEEQSFNTCPICLAASTRIDTPKAQVPVTELTPGMSIWTLDESGNRASASLEKAVRAPAPGGQQVVRVVLEDGREVEASPGHPLADGRTLGELAPGDELNGSRVISAERIPYDGFMYDILPGGSTGLYWANGVLLASTLGNAGGCDK